MRTNAYIYEHKLLCPRNAASTNTQLCECVGPRATRWHITIDKFIESVKLRGKTTMSAVPACNNKLYIHHITLATLSEGPSAAWHSSWRPECSCVFAYV